MNELIDVFTRIGQQRLILAGLIVLGFLLVCVAALLTGKPKRKKTRGPSECLVLFASQTGQAEEIARETHSRLAAGGVNAQLCALNDCDAEILGQAERIFCIVSTTGEGDAPDNALRFEQRVMNMVIDFKGRAFAVLALGDRNYEPFCTFGHRVFQWFEACGASALMPCIEVDDLDPKAIAQWNSLLGNLGAGAILEKANGFSAWRLVVRQRLNPTSEHPLYRIGLVPEDVTKLSWQAGDLAEIETRDGHRRDYSISSLPSEGKLQLLIRQVIRTDGSFGKGSGRLIHECVVGEAVSLRIKPHQVFRRPAGQGPIVMVAAGSGFAGLRPHVLDAADGARPVWLVYGERHPEHDRRLVDEMSDWKARDILHRLDLAWSRPEEGKGIYVQDVVADHGQKIQDRLGHDGAILICGGLAMGRSVEEALKACLGEAWLDKAFEDGRYRRDLY